MKAYVLIQTGANREPLARRVQAVPGVVSAEDLSGAYDAIAVADVASTNELVERVVAAIRDLPGVTRALPVPLVPSPGEGFGPEGFLRDAPRHVAAA